VSAALNAISSNRRDSSEKGDFTSIKVLDVSATVLTDSILDHKEEADNDDEVDEAEFKDED
jgi:hypothetical protein